MSKQDIFRFKQFDISHARSTMKVGTDAILLGSWADVANTNTILDIGTGCGIIALMLAQRSQAKIDAIDIDRASIEEASFNFENSPWGDRLQAYHLSLQSYHENSTSKYDLIVSNPPFFQNSLLPTKEKQQIAKHNFSLSYTELVALSAKMLNPKGRFAIILPHENAGQFLNLAESLKLYLQEQLEIFPTRDKSAKRVILVFGLTEIKKKNFSDLILRNKNGAFTKGYMKLTSDFHHKLPK